MCRVVAAVPSVRPRAGLDSGVGEEAARRSRPGGSRRGSGLERRDGEVVQEAQAGTARAGPPDSLQERRLPARQMGSRAGREVALRRLRRGRALVSRLGAGPAVAHWRLTGPLESSLGLWASRLGSFRPCPCPCLPRPSTTSSCLCLFAADLGSSHLLCPARLEEESEAVARRGAGQAAPLGDPRPAHLAAERGWHAPRSGLAFTTRLAGAAGRRRRENPSLAECPGDRVGRSADLVASGGPSDSFAGPRSVGPMPSSPLHPPASPRS